MIKLQSLIFENFQLAKKIYIDTNKIDAEGVEFLENLCGRDYTFKTLADLYIEDRADIYTKWNSEKWKNCHLQLKKYNKNVFPIQNFSFDSSEVGVTKKLIRDREIILSKFNSWPNIVKRNLKEDVRIPRSKYEFQRLLSIIEFIDMNLELLNNRPEKIKSLIYRKIFSSNHVTFNDVYDFVEDKNNLISGGSAFSKEKLYKIVKNNSDLNVVYDKNNIVIVDVTGQAGIKKIGCNSLWCFTYGNEYGVAGTQWDQYSHNGHVYAIINFSLPQDSSEFIHILIKPLIDGKSIPHYDPRQRYFPFKDDIHNDTDDDTGVYDMTNQMVYGNQYDIINALVKNDPDALKVFKFEEF